jgi:hypothetical protein
MSKSFARRLANIACPEFMPVNQIACVSFTIIMQGLLDLPIFLIVPHCYPPAPGLLKNIV